MRLRRSFTKKEKFVVPIISIGNLIVGGSGKTPFVIALATKYPHATIISRGYGRKSKGVVEVVREQKIIATVEESGDEAMLMANLLPNNIIVSEDRKKAIDYAISSGARLILLDDGFNRVGIKKFEILLEPQYIPNRLPFPAGPFREFSFTKKEADLILQEGEDFSRVVSFSNLREKMILVTAIANPQRLNKYLPKGVIAKKIFPDHAYFDEEVMVDLLRDSGADTLLVTQKDAVKLTPFMLPLSIMRLELDIDASVFESIDKYINNH